MMIPEITVMSTAVTMKADTMTHPTMMDIQNKTYREKPRRRGMCFGTFPFLCLQEKV